MNKLKEKFNKWAKENPESARQHIRDLYDKMFPTTQDYIKFLKKRFETANSIWNIGMILKQHQHQEQFAYWKEKTSTLNNEVMDNRFAEKNHWKEITNEQRKQYQKLTEQWLNTKTSCERKIWNYYVLGIPKKRIANLLKKDFEDSRIIIHKLQEDYIQKILPPNA